MQDNCRHYRVNGSRLWQSLMDMAGIGASPAGGCNRQALSDDDRRARDRFIAWGREAACTIKIDKVGNIFLRRAGVHDDLPPVVSGSHLDTQADGGRFDGVYGVLAALEVIRTLNDNKVETRHPLEVVVWSNEEGCRFSPAMAGSGVWAGIHSLEYVYAQTDSTGRTYAEELGRIGYTGEHACAAVPIKALLEAHIEQGPVLEDNNRQIGVVSGVQGLCWREIILQGESAHAGSTPMHSRRDAVRVLGAIIEQFFRLADNYKPAVRLTIGDIETHPGVYNTVAGKVRFTLDLRHPEAHLLEHIDNTLAEIVAAESRRSGVEFTINDKMFSSPVLFDDKCIAVIGEAAEALNYSHMKMVSGATHDAAQIARIVAAGMIFVPCEKGISHNAAENARAEDLEAGCNVLLHSILALAGQ